MKKRFHFDTENLVFIEEQITVKQYLKKGLRFLSYSILATVIVWLFVFFGFIESPVSMVIKKENQYLVNKISALNSDFDAVSLFLDSIQYRDDHIYRVISNIKPIPMSIRQAGFGGTDRYSNLESYNNSDVLISANLKSDILKSKLELQAESYDTIVGLVSKLNDSLLSSPAIAPVSPNGYITISSPFGYRFHPIFKSFIMHDGVDFAGNIGSPIYSTGNGVVASVEKNSNGYGNYVIINHGFHFQTLYGHMNKILVKEGDVITRGQQIGTLGNTGSSTGPHLHYEVIYDRIKRDPEKYFINDLSNDEYMEMVQTFTSK